MAPFCAGRRGVAVAACCAAAGRPRSAGAAAVGTTAEPPHVGASRSRRRYAVANVRTPPAARARAVRIADERRARLGARTCRPRLHPSERRLMTPPRRARPSVSIARQPRRRFGPRTPTSMPAFRIDDRAVVSASTRGFAPVPEHLAQRATARFFSALLELVGVHHRAQRFSVAAVRARPVAASASDARRRTCRTCPSAGFASASTLGEDSGVHLLKSTGPVPESLTS